MTEFRNYLFRNIEEIDKIYKKRRSSLSLSLELRKRTSKNISNVILDMLGCNELFPEYIMIRRCMPVVNYMFKLFIHVSATYLIVWKDPQKLVQIVSYSRDEVSFIFNRTVIVISVYDSERRFEVEIEGSSKPYELDGRGFIKSRPKYIYDVNEL